MKTHFSFKVRPVIVHFLVSLFYFRDKRDNSFYMKNRQVKKSNDISIYMQLLSNFMIHNEYDI